MEAVILMVTLYCGVPVSMMLSYPKDDERVVVAGPVTVDQRKFITDLMRQVAAARVGQLEVIKVEDAVPGVKCPVST